MTIPAQHRAINRLENPRLVDIVAVIRSYSRHVDGSDVEYQGTITAFSESSSLFS
jgi:hypothetical protein